MLRDPHRVRGTGVDTGERETAVGTDVHPGRAVVLEREAAEEVAGDVDVQAQRGWARPTSTTALSATASSTTGDEQAREQRKDSEAHRPPRIENYPILGSVLQDVNHAARSASRELESYGKAVLYVERAARAAEPQTVFRHEVAGERESGHTR